MQLIYGPFHYISCHIRIFDRIVACNLPLLVAVHHLRRCWALVKSMYGLIRLHLGLYGIAWLSPIPWFRFISGSPSHAHFRFRGSNCSVRLTQSHSISDWWLGLSFSTSLCSAHLFKKSWLVMNMVIAAWICSVVAFWSTLWTLCWWASSSETLLSSLFLHFLYIVNAPLCTSALMQLHTDVPRMWQRSVEMEI